MPKKPKNHIKNTKKPPKKRPKEIDVYRDYGSPGRRLTKEQKKGVLELFYLRGMSFEQIRKRYRCTWRTVQHLITETVEHDSELKIIKNQLLAERDQLLDKIIKKSAKQALKKVKDASYKDSMIGLGIASDHRYGKPDKITATQDNRKIVINYPNWERPVSKKE